MRFKLLKELFVALLPTCSVTIHPQSANFGKKGVEASFHMLRSKATKVERHARFAGRTFAFGLRPQVTEGTGEFVRSTMIDEGEITMRTFDDVTAGSAKLHTVKAPAVEKEEGLFSTLTALLHRFDELLRKVGKPAVMFIRPL